MRDEIGERVATARIVAFVDAAAVAQEERVARRCDRTRLARCARQRRQRRRRCCRSRRRCVARTRRTAVKTEPVLRRLGARYSRQRVRERRVDGDSSDLCKTATTTL